MGVYWRSYAGVISTEPEVIKQLIEEAATKDITTVCDLTIDGNCILFHSDGYGCYGTDFEDVHLMLFEFLFENYDKALVCFEMVKPCQSQGYCFNASWAKPNGEVDWDDEETFYIHRRVHLEDPDEDEGEFDIADIWFLSLKYLQSNKDLPNLMKLVNLAKEIGFTNWAINPTGYNSEPGILMETMWEISDYLEADLEEYDEDLVFEADLEAEGDRLEFLADIEIDDAEFELPFELPGNFCELITTFRKKVRGYLQEPNYKNNDNKQKLDNSSGLTLRLRTKNDLMELLQAQKSGAWKVAKGKEKQISRVQIFNWDGSMMLEAAHDVSNSHRRSEDNRLVVALNEDAKIIKCNPPFQWVGQNPVNYVDKTSTTLKNNLVEDKNIKQDSDTLVTQTETKESAPHASEGFAHVSPQLAELCEEVYGEPVRLIHWQMEEKNGEQQFSMLFREYRRGWYFQMLLTQQQGEWSSEHRVLPSFLNLLEPDETTWAKLSQPATSEDWYALDEIFLNTIIFPGSRVIFAGSDLIGEEVADEAMEKFGFYVPDEDMLPILLFEAPNFGVRLISYFRHPDGFAKENMVSDDNTEACEVYDSLAKAQKRLDQKLFMQANPDLTQL